MEMAAQAVVLLNLSLLEKEAPSLPRIPVQKFEVMKSYLAFSLAKTIICLLEMDAVTPEKLKTDGNALHQLLGTQVCVPRTKK